MIQLPDFKKAFDYENDFYLSCDPSRIGKSLAHYELFKMTYELTGDIIECGVFKGTSLIRFASFVNLFGNSKKIIAFDTFDKFPETNYLRGKVEREKFIASAGESSISKEQLETVLKHKNIIKNVTLIKGDIQNTIPVYVKNNSNLRISLLNLDTDIYEPAVTILKELWDRIVPGGILIVDDYGVFVGETKAVDEFFKDKKVTIRKFPFANTPSYIIKEK